MSTNAQEVAKFGIDTANMFEFWDWVGGRYSYDSAIGLSLMVAIGHEQFGEMLAGFRVDRRALPHRAVRARTSRCCSASSASGTTTSSTPRPRPSSRTASTSRRFPAYLQQLDMESNGKSVDLEGKPVTMQTGPIVWGQPGTNGQHAFYQLIHQGTKLIPCDFIGFVHANHEFGDAPEPAHRQPARADRGARVRQDRATRSRPRACPRRRCRTARSRATARPTPSWLERLTPHSLGQLVAIYEHKVFTQGTIWNINSFDQWGVELGKKLAQPRSSRSSSGRRARPAPRQQHQRAHPPVPPAPELTDG